MMGTSLIRFLVYIWTASPIWGQVIPIYMDDNSSDGVLNLTNGVIISHRGYPSTSYAPSIQTRLTLPTQNLQLTSLVIWRFLSFDVSDLYYEADDETFPPGRYIDTDCRYSDNLYMRGRRYCNYLTRQPVINLPFTSSVSTGETSLIQFRTNSDAEVGSGFSLDYTVAAVMYPDTSFHGDLALDEGYIVSHAGYVQEQYSRDVECSLTLRGLSNGQQVALMFVSFDMYYISSFPGCNHDYLEVTDLADEDDGTRRFCSDPRYRPALDTVFYVTARSDSITFFFRTNNYNSLGDGFLFKYSVIPYTTTPVPTVQPETTIRTTPGMGSSTTPTATGTANKTESTTVIYRNTTDGVEGDKNKVTDKRNRNDGAIGAGVAVTLLIIVAAVAVLLILFRRRRINKTQKQSETDPVYDTPASANTEDYYSLAEITPAPAGVPRNSRPDISWPLESSAAENGAYFNSLRNSDCIDSAAESSAAAAVAEEYGCIEDYRKNSPEPTGTAEQQVVNECLPADEMVYENFESMQRTEEEKEISDVYGVVTAATKTKKNVPESSTELLDNELYGS